MVCWHTGTKLLSENCEIRADLLKFQHLSPFFFLQNQINAFKYRLYLSRITRKPDYAQVKTKAQIICAVTAQRISAIAFAAQIVYEPVHEKTNNLHRRKQSRRSASR